MKILIGTPVKDSVPIEYTMAIVNMLNNNKQHDFVLGLEKGGLYDCRNRLCERAISDEFDYLLFIDSDMVWDSDAIQKCIDDNKDVITGLYVSAQYDHQPIIYKKIQPSINGAPSRVERGAIDPREPLFKVQGCGAGFLLIKVDVLKDLQTRYRNEWFTPFMNLGEDLSFNQRCLVMDKETWCDTTFSLGHVKSITYTINDWVGMAYFLDREELYK